MAFINQHTSFNLKTELDVFALPHSQNSIENGQYTTYRPLAMIGDDAPIEFVIPGSSDEYIDLAHTMLYLQVKLTRHLNLPAAEGEPTFYHNVAPVNNLLHSLFSQVDIRANQKCISPPSNCYNYRAYLENLLNYGFDSKHGHLQSSFWYKDTAGHMNASAENAGHEKRKQLSENGRVMDLFGNIHCDIFNQDKYLLNGVELGIKFIPAKPQMFLMSDQAAPNCTFEIILAELFVRKVKINPTIMLGHAEGLLINSAKYPINRVDIKTFTLPAPIMSKSLDNVYIGTLPKRCIIGLTRNSGFNGSFASNPYEFQNFNLNFLSLYVDSVQIPSKPFTPNYNNGIYMREYCSLYSGTGIHYSDHGLDISHAEFPSGYTLYSFDLTPDLSCNDSSWNLQKNGSLRIELRFAAALEESITVIVFSEFDSLIEIDKNRQITLDYSS
jgi:hypothetical protein